MHIVLQEKTFEIDKNIRMGVKAVMKSGVVVIDDDRIQKIWIMISLIKYNM